MPETTDSAALADDLRVVVGQVVRRLRELRALPPSQASTLAWIERYETRTTSQLAALEGVRPQSMAYTVAQLTEAGLVVRRNDPSDGRQTLLELSAAGRAAMDDARRSAGRWLSEAMSARLTDDERSVIARSVPLLARLVELDPPTLRRP